MLPILSSPQDTFDVAVVGGGIVGLSTALFLAEHGARTVLLEKYKVGWGQSSRAWGFIRMYGRVYGDYDLGLTARAEWERLSAHDRYGFDFNRVGYLKIARGRDGAQKIIQEIAENNALGLNDVAALTQGEMRDRFPYLHGSWDIAAYSPRDAYVEPVDVLDKLRKRYAESGGTLVEGCDVMALKQRRNAVTGLVTPKGKIRSSAVLLAAGADSPRLLAGIGIRTRVRVVRSSVARIAAAPTQDLIRMPMIATPDVSVRLGTGGTLVVGNGYANWRANYDLDLHSMPNILDFVEYFKTYRKNVRFSLSPSIMPTLLGVFGIRPQRASFEPCVNFKFIDRNLRTVVDLLGLMGAELQESWAGYIDSTIDQKPLIDRLPNQKNVFVAFGFSGYGLGLGPGVGKLVAEAMLTDVWAEQLKPFSLHRFQ